MNVYAHACAHACFNSRLSFYLPEEREKGMELDEWGGSGKRWRRNSDQILLKNTLKVILH